MALALRTTRRSWLTALALGPALPHAARAADPDGAIRQFVIGTGDPSGTYYPIGGSLANILTSPPGGEPCRPEDFCGVPGLLAVAQSTAGSVANLEGLASGRFASVLAQADVAFEAYHGGALFADGGFRHLRALAALYREVAQLVVRRPDHAPPWRLAVGAPRSGTRLTASVVLPAFGFDADDVVRLDMNPSEALAAMAAGEADGFLTVAGVPTGAVGEALRQPETTLVPLAIEAARAMLIERPHWRLVTLPSALYDREGAVRALAVPALWLVRDDLEPEFAHALLEALWAPAARDALDTGHPAGRAITLGSALEGISVPLHPGAERFYRERGLLAGGSGVLRPSPGSPSPRR